MLLRKLTSISLLMVFLAISAGCEEFEDAFDSDGNRNNKRSAELCTISNGSGECLPYEAEARTGQSGTSVATNHGGYTGTGFVDFGGNGSWIEWNNIIAPVAGEYTLTFRYANGSGGNRQAAVSVNGQQSAIVPFRQTGGWKTWSTATTKVSLRNGSNTMLVKANTSAGGPNLDNVLVVGKGLIEDECPNDPNKTKPGICGCGTPEGSCGNSDNVALGKPTSQSSIDFRGEASRAVDGNTSGRWSDGSITHTAHQAEPWWQVDLLDAYRVQSVSLFNRTDCCSDRLSDFIVDLLDENENPIATTYHQGQAKAQTDLDISGTGVHSVRVSLRRTNFLSLAEVQVFGSRDNGATEMCAEANEHKNATLSCRAGEKIVQIDFASYGLPTGSCDAGFQEGSCHSLSSKSKVESICLNRPSCIVSANNGTFGDPCPGKSKRFSVTYSCSGGDTGDLCPNDSQKTSPGICGCGTPDIDGDGDNTPDCKDDCPLDSNKTQPGECGCGTPEGNCGVIDGPPEGIPGFGSPPMRCTPAGFSNSDNNPTNVGPMVGHTTHNSALIWAHFPNASKIEVEYWRADSISGSAKRSLIKDSTGDSSRVILSGLSANTMYVYRLLVNGKNHDGCYGWFKTMPIQYTATKFKYVFGSGTRFQRHPTQPVWERIAKYEPDMLILNGDNIYLSGENEADYNYAQKITRYRKQRYGHVSNGKVFGFPWFAGILRSMPIYAIWDDHDYGPNDSTSSFSKKEESRRGFIEMWGNPSHGENGSGIYTRFSRGDVEFFLVDNRWFRTSGAYLGSKQMAWLKAGLLDAHSRGAKFKIIVHGGTLHGWFGNSAERNELLGFLSNNRISGVVWHDGDSHWNSFNPYPMEPSTNGPHYKAVALMSSGLSYSARYVTVEIDTTLANPTLTFELHGSGNHRTDGGKGQLILQNDGRMKHVVIGQNGGFRVPDRQEHLREAIISPW